jgi:hypothetical protein
MCEIELDMGQWEEEDAASAAVQWVVSIKEKLECPGFCWGDVCGPDDFLVFFEEMEEPNFSLESL